jgi:hypothetical protein
MIFDNELRSHILIIHVTFCYDDKVFLWNGVVKQTELELLILKKVTKHFHSVSLYVVDFIVVLCIVTTTVAVIHVNVSKAAGLGVVSLSIMLLILVYKMLHFQI